MRVLHISFSDKAGGAAIAAFRHNEALNRLGYDSKMLVVDRRSGSKNLFTPAGRPSIIRLKAQVLNFVSGQSVRKFKPYAAFSNAVLGFNIASEPIVGDADVIVLHWVNAGMLSIKGVEAILKLGKPTYWFLHDMWPMTGGCHYSLECRGYEHHCGKCPLLFNKEGSDKEKDITYHQLGKKLWAWNKYENLRILAPSKWLADCASRSAVFKGHSIEVLRNVVDTDLYKPADKSVARKILNLPQDKKLVLFGADNINSPYKGWSYLKEALSCLNPDEVECVVFGSGDKESFRLESEIKVHSVGRLSDDYTLVLLYNACDLFVTPSIADNYPNVILEAMACGLPCVGFNVGGIPELIQHRHTGFVSNEMSAENLVNGIQWVLNFRSNNLGNNAREWVINHSSYLSLKYSLTLL